MTALQPQAPLGVPATVIAPVMSQILEAMYFCLPDYCGSSLMEGPAIGACLAFSGSTNGVFRVIASRARAMQFAADFLSMEPTEVPQSELHATIRELTNVACCASIATWMPGEEFHFAIPRDFDPGSEVRPLPHCFSFDSGEIGMAVEITFG